MLNRFVDGDYNVVCDRCGFKHKGSQLKLEWTGLRVCGECYEVRHPQTLIHIPQEAVNPAWTRPEPTDVFISLSTPMSAESDANAWLTTEAGVILNTEG